MTPLRFIDETPRTQRSDASAGSLGVGKDRPR
jgi:hypothetical protein